MSDHHWWDEDCTLFAIVYGALVLICLILVCSSR